MKVEKPECPKKKLSSSNSVSFSGSMILEQERSCAHLDNCTEKEDEKESLEDQL